MLADFTMVIMVTVHKKEKEKLNIFTDLMNVNIKIKKDRITYSSITGTDWMPIFLFPLSRCPGGLELGLYNGTWLMEYPK